MDCHQMRFHAKHLEVWLIFCNSASHAVGGEPMGCCWLVFTPNSCKFGTFCVIEQAFIVYALGPIQSRYCR